MAIINYKPTTNARRNMSTTDFSAVEQDGSGEEPAGSEE